MNTFKSIELLAVQSDDGVFDLVTEPTSELLEVTSDELQDSSALQKMHDAFYLDQPMVPLAVAVSVYGLGKAIRNLIRR